MITRRYLEKESTILGLPMAHVGLLVGLMVTMIMASSVIKIVFGNAPWFNHLTMIVLVGGYALLRYTARQKHPTFLSSHLSYRFLQRGKHFLPMNNPTIKNRRSPKR